MVAAHITTIDDIGIIMDWNLGRDQALKIGYGRMDLGAIADTRKPFWAFFHASKCLEMLPSTRD